MNFILILLLVVLKCEASLFFEDRVFESTTINIIHFNFNVSGVLVFEYDAMILDSLDGKIVLLGQNNTPIDHHVNGFASKGCVGVIIQTSPYLERGFESFVFWRPQDPLVLPTVEIDSDVFVELSDMLKENNNTVARIEGSDYNVWREVMAFYGILYRILFGVLYLGIVIVIFLKLADIRLGKKKMEFSHQVASIFFMLSMNVSRFLYFMIDPLHTGRLLSWQVDLIWHNAEIFLGILAVISISLEWIKILSKHMNPEECFHFCIEFSKIVLLVCMVLVALLILISVVSLSLDFEAFFLIQSIITLFQLVIWFIIGIFHLVIGLYICIRLRQVKRKFDKQEVFSKVFVWSIKIVLIGILDLLTIASIIFTFIIVGKHTAYLSLILWAMPYLFSGVVSMVLLSIFKWNNLCKSLASKSTPQN